MFPLRCAPGYDVVTSYLVEFLSSVSRSVFVANEGFRSLVSGGPENFSYLVHNRQVRLNDRVGLSTIE